MTRDFMKMIALSLTSLLLLVAAALVNSGRL
jgi:type II secretory pathway component PulJ